MRFNFVHKEIVREQKKKEVTKGRKFYYLEK